MNVISPIWEKLLVIDSYACICGRDIHSGSRRTMGFVRRNKYVLKCDILKFYPSVDQDILMRIVERKIKCKDTLWLIYETAHSFPDGKNVPIGNYIIKGSVTPTKEKMCRNRICGIGILVFIGSQVLTSALFLDGPYTMINEIGMLERFGVTWLVKGEAVLEDKVALRS
jgi:hypothetical protein